MNDDTFTRLEASNGDHPKIATQIPLALFYKKRLTDQVLYTMVEAGQIHTFEANDYQKLHQDQDFELMYVLQGQLTNQIEGQSFTFSTGEGCLLNPQITHAEALATGCTVMFINLSRALLFELMPKVTTFGPIFKFLDHNSKLENNWQRSYLEFTPSMPYPNVSFQIILDALQQEMATKKIGATYFQHGLVLRLLAALEDPTHFNVTTTALDLSKEDYLVNRVIHLVENHYGNISRTQIEQVLHYNAEYLNRLLKKQTGQTITAYAQKVRLQKAQQLLVTTDLKIQLIAERLGFNSETYFYHYFKKQAQLSPNQYRQKFKSN
ncbi:AraC family transcriptional regulator [Lactiplantibacillus mudanjiangensis]|uniref:AraC family transcriptional regulator [Lactobacillus pentosus] n=1 Tax=Lactiplantibacillus mudanjiangensis TaxID=1296538 RepID=A0A660DU26_9LACO|nr:AraC family transcriptional regulator [Lactiplantibacillus mudanjiangensis]VDG22504.1 AraC family transcriptional regulator [Lactobacillus pentosus] [Lactiplantibacillus mudanjiangensis]VDG26947.1 AraC family transcriptional regulator [Lactobacillus pentosus] [Lactiplantibacillus mudanjiangensis]